VVLDELRDKLFPIYSYEQIYKSIGRSRQSYFQSKVRKASNDQLESVILTFVRNWRERHSKMGSRSMYKSMQCCGIELDIGITKFEQLMSKHNLTIRKFKSGYPKTTDSTGSNKHYPNLTNGLIVKDINELIVADITYIWVLGKWHYLFIFKDVYSQRILSIIPSWNMNTENCITALNEVIGLRGESSLVSCIFHSDNGKQFDAKAFKKILKDQLEMRISRSKTSQQNGSAEQVNHVAKNMYILNWQIGSFKDLENACQKFKYLNNHERAIKQLGYKTPVMFEKAIQSIPLEKRIKQQLYDFEN